MHDNINRKCRASDVRLTWIASRRDDNFTSRAMSASPAHLSARSRTSSFSLDSWGFRPVGKRPKSHNNIRSYSTLYLQIEVTSDYSDLTMNLGRKASKSKAFKIYRFDLILANILCKDSFRCGLYNPTRCLKAMLEIRKAKMEESRCNLH